MIRPSLNITTEGGAVTVYPPLQWNEITSERKMLEDCRAWLHSHQPTWMDATVNLKYHNYVKSFKIERR